MAERKPQWPEVGDLVIQLWIKLLHMVLTRNSTNTRNKDYCMSPKSAWKYLQRTIKGQRKFCRKSPKVQFPMLLRLVVKVPSEGENNGLAFEEM